MCDLIVLLDKIQLFLDRWVILVTVLAHLEQNFDHVLCSLVDAGFVEDVSKLVIDDIGNRGAHLFEELADLATEANGDFNAVIGRLIE